MPAKISGGGWKFQSFCGGWNKWEAQADTLFLRLSENWALATDGIQWIVQRARRNRNKVGGLEWRAVAFVASDKGVLHRVLREKGAVIDPDALEHLRALPAPERSRDQAKTAA